MLLAAAYAAAALSAARKSFELVVCRWGEDVAWAKEFNHTIYDKGKGDVLSSDIYNTVPVDKNVGKENYCYLSHILKHYHG